MDKIKKWLNQFTDPVIEKVTAPFGITYVLVWLFHNWKVVYSILSFDETTPRQQRIDVILSYNNSGSLFGLSNDFLLIPLWWSLLALVSFYLVSAIALAIVTFYNRWMRPFVFNLINRNHLVTKSDYLDVKYKLKKTEELNFELEEEINKKQNKIDTLSDINSQCMDKNNELLDENARLSFVKKLFQNPDLGSWSDKWKEEFNSIEYKLEEWLRLIYFIVEHRRYNDKYNTDLMEQFLKLDLIEKMREDEDNLYFQLTHKGIEFYKFVIHHPSVKFD